MQEGLLLIISGPSGVGKGTVCRHLMTIKEGLNLSVSTTTRIPRPEEIDGKEYFFTKPGNFKAMIDAGAFLEWAVVHGHYYGTSLDVVDEAISKGETLILEIDVQGAAQVRQKAPESVSIFLAPPSMKTLEDRIRGRGTENNDKIERRLMTARQEMNSYILYDYLVVNDKVEKAAAKIGAIIDAEKCKVNRGAQPPGMGGEDG